jgi:hypothetical protein
MFLLVIGNVTNGITSYHYFILIFLQHLPVTSYSNKLSLYMKTHHMKKEMRQFPKRLVCQTLAHLTQRTMSNTTLAQSSYLALLPAVLWERN